MMSHAMGDFVTPHLVTIGARRRRLLKLHGSAMLVDTEHAFDAADHAADRRPDDRADRTRDPVALVKSMRRAARNALRLRASALRIAYGTSKAALEHLTKQLALELSVRGIRVNAVAPGPVDTAMAKAVHSAAIRADYHDAIPLGRYGLEEEIAEAVFFLASERASYITGQVLAVDGGFDAIGIGLPTFRREEQDA